MCGINFIVDKKGALDNRPIASMVESLSHRGQDFQSIYTHTSGFSQYFFGASRLMIINRDDNSNQPFFDSEKTSVLLFNGEIYNYFDLKNELINLGYQFRTNSDTEALLYWVREFGSRRLSDLDGMYAFVYFDLITEEFICARDRFGVKPLYYFESENFLVFSSEIRAINSSNISAKALNENAIPHYLLYRYAQAPETFYKGIYQFPKGHFSRSSGESKLKFEKIEEEVFDHTHSRVEVFKEVIRESLLKQVHSNAGVGLMLSGGVDSSLLLSLAIEEGVSMPAVSVFAKENGWERQIAEQYAAKHLVKHEVLEVDDLALDRFDEYIDILDQPISDSAGLLTFLLAEKTSPDLKVLLSGAGADELFGGYNRHYAYYQYLRHSRKLLFLKKICRPLNGENSVGNSSMLKFLQNIDKDPRQTFLNFSSLHFSVFREQIHWQNEVKELNHDPLLWALEFDRSNYLPDDVLSISDVTAMAAGLEIRLPFLDHEVVKLVRRTDPSYLISKGRKWILKELLREYTAKKHINYPKTGFGLPLKNWLRLERHKRLWDLLQNKNSIIFRFLDYNFVQQLIQSHQNRKQDNTQALWSVLTLGHWLHKEFE